MEKEGVIIDSSVQSIFGREIWMEKMMWLNLIEIVTKKSRKDISLRPD